MNDIEPQQPKPSTFLWILGGTALLVALVIWLRKRGALEQARLTLLDIEGLDKTAEDRRAQAEVLANHIQDVARNKIFTPSLSPNAKLRYGVKVLKQLADEEGVEIKPSVWTMAKGLAGGRFGPGMRAAQTLVNFGG